MDLGIRDRVAVVCGASAGLGRAAAAALAREGAKVAICSRNAAALEAAARAMESSHGSEVVAFPADVTDVKAVEAFLSEVTRKLGAPEILVNNAGGPPPGNFEEISDEAWDPTHSLTLRSAVGFCRRVLPAMKQRGWGRIVSITSLTVKQPAENLILSNTYRSALTAFSKTLAGEVAPFGITVNCVCPGYTATERLAELAESVSRKQGIPAAEVRQNWEKSIPAGRLGRPEEVADLIAYLASDRAAYITGASILVDGGFVRALV